MANNKHRSNEDNFLKYIIIGFGVIILGLVAWSILDSSANPVLDYDDFEQVGLFEAIEDYDDELFGLYYYSETCPSCIDTKPRMLEFADGNDLNMQIYLMDAYGTLGNKDIVVGPLGELLQYTPTLVIYANGVVTEFIVGGDEIAAFLDDVESGFYTIN